MKIEMEDGWDLEEFTPLNDIERAITELEDVAYELRNCVRTMTLQEMRDKINDLARDLKNACDEINDDDEIVEREEQ